MFFDKCITGALEENDFELGDKSRKGSIRKKIKVLKTAVNLFDGGHIINVEERFIKNKIVFNKNNLSLSEIVQLLPLEMRA